MSLLNERERENKRERERERERRTGRQTYKGQGVCTGLDIVSRNK